MKPCGGCAKRREQLKALAARVGAAAGKKMPAATAEARAEPPTAGAEFEGRTKPVSDFI